MKTVKVLSKNAFDRFCLINGINDSSAESFKDFAFISIHNTNDNYEYAFSKNHSNVLNLTFDDVEEDISEKFVFAMTSEQARKLFDFIVENSHKSKFVIHCTAGISRSGAVGTFIAHCFALDMKAFNLANPHILPNSHVLKMLNSILWEEHFKEL